MKSQESIKRNQLHIIEQDYRIELIRKSIHLFSLSIPIIYFVIPKSTALSALLPMTLVFLGIDLARHYITPVEYWVNKYFGFLLRKRENDKKRKPLNGATYVLISATFCVLFFPKIITITSFSILIICDITSALVGRKYGKHRFIAKSLEGSAAFFISGLIVVAVTPKIEYQLGEYLAGAAAALVGAVVEALPAEIDDNLSIPISVGAVLWLLYHFFFPMLNVYKFG